MKKIFPFFISFFSFFIPAALFALTLTLFSCQKNSEPKTGYIPVSGGGRIYYEEQGEGEPVILLHGHSLDTRMWDRQFGAIAEAGYRVVRLDFRGYGRSSEQSESFQHTHMDDVLTVMDSLRIPRAHLVGLSMGSFVAGDMVAMCPERIISCVMASGSVRSTPGPSEPMDSVESASRDREIAELKEKGIQAMKDEWLETLMSSGGSGREKMLRKPLRKMISDWSAWQPLHKEVRLFYGRDAQRVLEKRHSPVPALFITGENEKRPNAPSMSRWMEHFQYQVLPDCGHMLNMEQPQAFNEAVIGFIRQHPDLLPPTRFGGLQTGDLVFVTHPSQTGGLDTIHVASLDVQTDGVFVIDATLRHGVDRHPLDTLFSDFTRHDGSVCDMYVMRLKENDKAYRWITSALTYTGEPYDLDFTYDNAKHYCSELVHDTYLTLEGTPIFPDSSDSCSGENTPVSEDWKRLFGLMHMPLPKRNPDISPAEISRNGNLINVPVDITTLSSL